MEDQQTPTQFMITVELSDKIVTYLDSKPHGEVVHLIGGLRMAYQNAVVGNTVKINTPDKKEEEEEK